MAKCAIKIQETLSKIVIVDANNYWNVVYKANKAYRNCKVILSSEDYDSVDYQKTAGF